MGGTDDPTRVRIAKWVFFVLAGMGLFIMLGAWSLYKQSTESKRWPTTKGIVTESRVERFKDVTSYTEHRGINKGKTRIEVKIMFRPIVKYNYTVGIEKFNGERISFFTGASATNEYGATVCGKYPVDSAVKVYYDPDSPSQSVLEPGEKMVAIYIFLSVGAFIFLVSLPVLYGWRKVAREQREFEEERERKLEEGRERKRQREEKEAARKSKGDISS